MRKTVWILFLALAFLACQNGGYKKGNYSDDQSGKNQGKFRTHEVTAFSDSALADKELRNIVLLIGDGLGVSQISAAATANHNKLFMEQLPVVGLNKTYSASAYITDSGAAGTAIATGHKTKNQSIGVNADGQPVQSILELAEANGYATGLVSTSKITHATPAAFIAHEKDRNSYEAIAADFLDTDIEVFIGGGEGDFAARKDGQNLVETLQARDYTIACSIEQVQNSKGEKLAGLLNEGHLPRYSERGEMLVPATEKALEMLSANKKGFFLMVEASQIDWGGHENSARYVIEETLDFDRAVGKALEFAVKDGHTLVIVTSDHETGGMSVVNGNFDNGEVTSRFSTGNHSGAMVPVFAFGPKSQLFQGVYENTDIFKKMRKAYAF